MTVKRDLLVVVATAIAYVGLVKLNDFFFSSFSFSNGVDWIFLPSGLRLAFILVFVEWGAVGVAIASILLSYFSHTWLGQTTHFIYSTLVMTVGDFSGTVLVLYASKLVLTTLLPTVGSRSS